LTSDVNAHNGFLIIRQATLVTPSYMRVDH